MWSGDHMAVPALCGVYQALIMASLERLFTACCMSTHHARAIVTINAFASIKLILMFGL
jgi:hypothetical protein